MKTFLTISITLIVMTLLFVLFILSKKSAFAKASADKAEAKPKWQYTGQAAADMVKKALSTTSQGKPIEVAWGKPADTGETLEDMWNRIFKNCKDNLEPNMTEEQKRLITCEQATVNSMRYLGKEPTAAMILKANEAQSKAAEPSQPKPQFPSFNFGG